MRKTCRKKKQIYAVMSF